jgi:antitoxin MazE
VIKIKINLAKWGNSAAIRIPKKILEKLNIDSNNFENISFDIDIEGEVLILKKKQEKTKFELLAEQSKGEKLNPKIDIDWGNPVGKEVW